MPNYGKANDPQRISYYDAHEWNLDKSVSPQTMVRGAMGKDTGGTWRYLRVSASGAISNDDAANFRVSSLGVSEDAGQFRVSAVGGTAGDNTFVDGEDQLVSANLVVSARSVSPTSANKGVVVAALSPDAQYFRVSATETSPVTTVSSHLLGGSIDNTSFEATQDDAGLLRVSAMGVDIADVSNSDAGDFRTSAIQGDAANLRISAINTLSANESVSAVLLGGTANVGSVNVEKAKGELSTNNSSTTPLGGDAVFTGTADEIKDYAAVNVSIWADQDSAADGLSLEWSQDNVNWDEKMTVSIDANKAESYEFGVRARYFRIVYTNGGAAQGAFRLQVILHPTRTRMGARCLCVDIDPKEFAATRRAVLAAKKPDGVYTNIHATTAGNLKVAVEEYDYDDAGTAPVSAFCGDAGQLRVSATVTNTVTTVSAHNLGGSIDNTSFEATQGDAGLLRVSSTETSPVTTVSAHNLGGSIDNTSFDVTQDDAGLLRVSALGVDIADVSNSDAGDFRTSSIGTIDSGYAVSAVNDKIALIGGDDGTAVRRLRTDSSGRVDTILDSGSVSATITNTVTTVSAHNLGGSIDNTSFEVTQADASDLMVSGRSDDAALFRVSSTETSPVTTVSAHNLGGSIDNTSFEATQGDAANLKVSATITNTVTTVSAHNLGGSIDNTSFGATQADASNLMVSAKSNDGGLFRVSSIQTDGANLNVSAKSSDAGTLHVSAYPAPMATFWTSAFDIGTGNGVAVVNGVAAKKIKIFSVHATLNASGGIKWRSGSTELQGITRLSASAGYVMCVNPPAYLFGTTSAGQDLNLLLSATGVSASGWVTGWSE